VIEAIAPNDSVERFTAMGVHVIQEYGRFTDRRTLVAGDYEIKPRRFVDRHRIVALRAADPRPRRRALFHQRDDLRQTRKPGHLIVIGGGPIGMEMAQAHRRLGSEVTVIEGLKALGKDDPELAAIVLDRIRAEGVAIHEGAKVVEIVNKSRSTVTVRFETEAGPRTRSTGTHILVATGRKPNVERLDLDKAGVKPSKKPGSRSTGAAHDQPPNLRHRRCHRRAAIHPCRRLSCRPRCPDDPVPPRRQGEPRHHPLGDLHRSRTRPCRPDRGRGAQAESQDRSCAGPMRKTTAPRPNARRPATSSWSPTARAAFSARTIAGAGAGEMINLFALALANKMKAADLRATSRPIRP
jgi:hypothetical protein